MATTCFWAVFLLLAGGQTYVSSENIGQIDLSIFGVLNAHVVQKCSEKNLNMGDLMDGYWGCLHTDRTANRKVVTNFYLEEQICSENELIKCIKSYRKKFEMCLNKEELDVLSDDILNYVKSGFDNLCNNDAWNLREFNKDESRRCLAERKGEMTACRKNVEIGLNKIVMPDNSISLSFRYDELCNLRGQWATCVVESLDKCKDKLAKKVVQGVLAASLLATPCKDVIYRSFNTLIPSEPLEAKTTTTTTTTPTVRTMASTSAGTTTDKTTAGNTQPVVDEKAKTNEPVKQNLSDAATHISALGLGIHVLIAYCLLTNVYQVIFSGH